MAHVRVTAFLDAPVERVWAAHVDAERIKNSALEQAITVARREDANILGLHTAETRQHLNDPEHTALQDLRGSLRRHRRAGDAAHRQATIQLQPEHVQLVLRVQG